MNSNLLDLKETCGAKFVGESFGVSQLRGRLVALINFTCFVLKIVCVNGLGNGLNAKYKQNR
jgi:hypothetical protein